MKLIVGLGNPGEGYVQTRHNVGFWVVERLATKSWKEDKELRAVTSGPYESQIARTRDERRKTKDEYLLAKPTISMNLSGKAVKRLLKRFKLEPRERSGLSDLWVIHDDADLALGVIRIQESGKRSTHNGIQSVVEAVEGQPFVRFRLGIGSPPTSIDWEDYVLTPFSLEEVKTVNEGVRRMTEAVETALTEGIVMAMNRYNRK
jgi:PTH1 family peptidyl-tRNA hydrolase